MTDLTINAKASGRFKFEVKRGDTGKVETYHFSNMLLNSFFQGQSQGLLRFELGTDSIVNPSDTAINSIGASTAIVSSNSGYSAIGTMVSINIKNVCAFGVGSVIGNVSSIGIKNRSDAGGVLVIKTLTKDQDGNPVSISLGAGDQATVTHILTLTINQKPSPIILNIDGTNHSLQFYSGLLDGFSGPTRIHAASPFLFSYNSSLGGNMVMAAAASMLADGNFTSKISLSQPIGLGMATSYDYSESNLGKMHSISVASALGNNNFLSDAPIAFIGVMDLSYGPGYCQFGFQITPALPKNSSIGYTFTIKMTLSR